MENPNPAQTNRAIGSRRDFMVTSAVLGSGFALGACASAPRRRTLGPNDKLNIAVVGAGGKGAVDTNGCKDENIVALCDVDMARAAKTFAKFPKAARYSDYRVMFEREKNLDAVVISTPDHMHAPVAVAALQLGLHVFCQKPLTHSVEEARVLADLAEKQGVATQMGNQGTAMNGFREAVEVIRSGAIGDVREVHVWTNRPIWKQGEGRPEEVLPIPTTLRWDLWLGCAPYRPFSKGYAPFSWRGFWDFGTGALGDMACHIMNLPYLGLELGAPTSVDATSTGLNDEMAPKGSKVTYEFPARGDKPAVTLYWYDGKNRPSNDLVPGIDKLSSGGSLLVGSKGSLYSPDDYGRVYHLHPKEKFEAYKPPTPSLPRCEGVYKEWTAACKGGPQAMSHFGHAGAFTETVLLGNVAIRTGQKILWDPASMKATGCPAADAYLRKEYGYGYSI